jgi:hypothetical protein
MSSQNQSPSYDPKTKTRLEQKSSDFLLKILAFFVVLLIATVLFQIIGEAFFGEKTFVWIGNLREGPLTYAIATATVFLSGYGFYYYLKEKVLPFFFPEPIEEPPIPFGKFDRKLFQPEKWGVDPKRFYDIFKSKEDYEKFVRTIDKRLERKVETFEGKVIEFNPDEINELIGKLLNIIEKEGEILSGIKIEDKEHMRIALGMALFHAILFHFGHVPSETLGIFIKDKVVKKVLSEYHKGKSIQASNEVFKKAGQYLKYLHITKLKPFDFPEDINLFEGFDMSVLEYINKKFRTIPEK